MIETVAGLGVGSGKSYYVTTRIVKYLAEGGIVWASSKFALNWAATKALVADRYGVEVEDDQFTSFPQEDVSRLHEVTPPGTEEKPLLIVIDEAHTELNARDWADKNKRAFFDWLTQSRHDNNDVIFISQAAANIDKQVARLVTNVVRVRNMLSFPILGFKMKRFCVARFDQDGRTLIGSKQYIPHDKGIFGCYTSKSCSGSHKRLMAGIPPKRLKKITRKNPMYKWFIIGFLALIAFGSYKFWKFKNRESEPGRVRPPAGAVEPGKGTAAAKEQPAEYRNEEFKHFSDSRRLYHEGPATLRTAQGVYIEGEASAFGMVIALRAPNLSVPYAVAKCVNGGKVTFVVAQAFVKQSEVQQIANLTNAQAVH